MRQFATLLVLMVSSKRLVFLTYASLAVLNVFVAKLMLIIVKMTPLVQQISTFIALITPAYIHVLEDSMLTLQLKYANHVRMDVNYVRTVLIFHVLNAVLTQLTMCLTSCP